MEPIHRRNKIQWNPLTTISTPQESVYSTNNNVLPSMEDKVNNMRLTLADANQNAQSPNKVNLTMNDLTGEEKQIIETMRRLYKNNPLFDKSDEGMLKYIEQRRAKRVLGAPTNPKQLELGNQFGRMQAELKDLQTSVKEIEKQIQIATQARNNSWSLKGQGNDLITKGNSLISAGQITMQFTEEGRAQYEEGLRLKAEGEKLLHQASEQEKASTDAINVAKELRQKISVLDNKNDQKDSKFSLGAFVKDFKAILNAKRTSGTYRTNDELYRTLAVAAKLTSAGQLAGNRVANEFTSGIYELVTIKIPNIDKQISAFEAIHQDKG